MISSCLMPGLPTFRCCGKGRISFKTNSAKYFYKYFWQRINLIQTYSAENLQHSHLSMLRTNKHDNHENVYANDGIMGENGGNVYYEDGDGDAVCKVVHERDESSLQR